MNALPLLVIAALTTASIALPSPSGEWGGTYSNNDANGDVWVRVGNANGAWTAAVKATTATLLPSLRAKA